MERLHMFSETGVTLLQNLKRGDRWILLHCCYFSEYASTDVILSVCTCYVTSVHNL